MAASVASLWAEAAAQLSHPSPNDVAQSWSVATAYLAPKDLALAQEQLPSPQVIHAGKVLGEANLQAELLKWHTVAVTSNFHLIERDILLYNETRENADSMFLLLDRLLDWFLMWRKPIQGFGSDQAISSYRRQFQVLLYKVIPPTFVDDLRVLLSRMLENIRDPSQVLPVPPARVEQAFHLLGIIERFEPVIFSVVYNEIENKIKTDYEDDWETPDQIMAMLLWLNGEIGEWVLRMYETGLPGGREQAKNILRAAFQRFEFHINKAFFDLRTSQLFNIIVDFPTSLPALKDLRSCLVKTDSRNSIVTQMHRQNAKRLLHPGADTKDIISQYINTMKAFKILDPQGVLLSRIASPIREYLRAREDTIRCIVMSLVEEGSDLVAELTAGDNSENKLETGGADQILDYNDPAWVPDPVDAPADFRKSRQNDVLQMLVSIYDSKDLFVAELQVLLAQRLLSIRNYEFEREVRNLEILKLRFGETTLQNCEVMLKDLADSKRLDTNLHDLPENKNLPVHATVVSHLFWPPFQTAPMTVPGQLKKAQQDFERAFKKHKPDKYLIWIPQLGSVSMTIELRDRTVDVEATPLQAAVLELFSTSLSWSTATITKKLVLNDTGLAKNACYFWANQGVIKETRSDHWVLLETVDTEKAKPAHFVEDMSAPVEVLQQEQLDQMRLHWQYIQGMLTNLGSLPTDRIHSMLSTYLPSYRGTPQDHMQRFLERLEGERLLESVGNMWKLVK